MSIETNKYHNPVTLTAPLLGPDDDLGLAALARTTPAESSDADAPRIIGGVAVRRPLYRTTLIGHELLDGRAVYHLALEPLRDPARNRLRDAWIDTTTFETQALTVANLGIGGYYDRMAWPLTYAMRGKYRTIQRATAIGSMKAFLGGSLDDWSIAFDDFTYPETIPPWVFDLTITY